eukprot:jgi/Botrbrau1/2716/Bobra.0203s0058.1
MAAGHIVKEANWLRGFLEEIGAAPWRVKVFCDNQGLGCHRCISNLRNPLYSKFTTHVAVSFHYAREAMAVGQDNSAEEVLKTMRPFVVSTGKALHDWFASLLLNPGWVELYCTASDA